MAQGPPAPPAQGGIWGSCPQGPWGPAHGGETGEDTVVASVDVVEANVDVAIVYPIKAHKSKRTAENFMLVGFLTK